MGVCDTVLAGDIKSPCTVKKGMKRTAKLINRSQITNLNAVNNAAIKITKLLSAITLKQGGKALKVVVPGDRPFEGLAQNLEVGTYDKTFTTDIPIVILGNDEATAMQIKQLANGTFVLVVENNDYTGTDTGRYQVYGWECGLKISAATREPNGDNPGWAITLHEEGATEAAIFLAAAGWTALTVS